jgi:hypothetical protein
MRDRLRKLRHRAEKIVKKIKRRQSWRQKARKLQKQLGKKIGGRLDGLIKALSKQIKALHHELEDVHDEIDELERKIEESKQGNRSDYVKWVLNQVGVVEYSTKHRAWAADLGYSAALPWCSIFAAYGLKHHGGFSGRLPSNPAYSGAWLTWSHGRRVSYSQAQPGDLLVFDWGDGGITDHVATYVGGGIKVGGNENNRVEKDAVPTANIVAVIRPDWD